jgi:hypothetical protein
MSYRLSLNKSHHLGLFLLIERLIARQQLI